MAKYKEYYYTTKRNEYGKYDWTIRNKEHDVLQSSTTSFYTKKEAELSAQEEIDEYYY